MERREGWLYSIYLLFEQLRLGWELRQNAVDMSVKPLWFLFKQRGIGGKIGAYIEQGIVHTSENLKDMRIVYILLYICYKQSDV